MDTQEVDPTNIAQAQAWDGAEGGFWADHAELFDETVARYQDQFLAAADIRLGDQVLDIGCGTGQTARAAARLAHDGHVLGIDLSQRMLDVARRLAAQEGLVNVSFERADAQIHRFAPAAFDRLISRTGSMFFGDSVAAFSNLAYALKPGGRVTLLTWQPLAANEWVRALVTALTERPPPDPPPTAPGPFSLSDPDRVRGLLTGCGFTEVEVTGRQEPMSAGRDADEAEVFVLGQLGWLLAGTDEVGRREAQARLRTSLQAHHTANGVLYDSAAWLITARRG